MIEPDVNFSPLDFLKSVVFRNRLGLSGNCPPREPERNLRCWKFENQDPNTEYDFWMLLTIQKAGDMIQLTELVPLDDGDLVLFIKYNDYNMIMRNHYIKKIEIEHGAYGPVQVSRLKVQEYSQGVQTTIFKTEFSFLRFRRDVESDEFILIESRKGTAEDFPPPPSAPPCHEPSLKENRLSPENLLARLDMRSIRGLDAIRFDVEEASLEEEDPDKYVVLNGAVYHCRRKDKISLADSLMEREPGIYIDLAEQGGNPSLVMTIYTIVSPRQPPRVLFVHYCTGLSYHKMQEWVFIKKKRSWFKSKTIIYIVRKELRIEKQTCREL